MISSASGVLFVDSRPQKKIGGVDHTADFQTKRCGQYVKLSYVALLIVKASRLTTLKQSRHPN